jgi:hypothetical protein
MARTKAAHRDTAPDDAKSETATGKDKSGHSSTHHSNGKLRRVASSTGTNLREANSAAAPTSAPAPSAAAPEHNTPSVRQPPQGTVLPLSLYTAFSLTCLNRTASMACLRPRRSSLLPTSLPTQHLDSLYKRRTPMGPSEAWRHRAALTNNG